MGVEQKVGMPFRERLTGGVILFDGAMGTMLLDHVGEHNPARLSLPLEYLNVADPERVLSIHLAYLGAGAEVITTNTFCANTAFLDRYHLSGEMAAINLGGVRLAREAIRQYGLQAAQYIAGSIGPIQAGATHPKDVAFEAYRSQAYALIEGEVDCLLLETFPTMEQAECGLAAACQARREADRDIPVVLSFAPTSATTAIEVDQWREGCLRLSDIGADCFGANCGDNQAAFGALLNALRGGVEAPLLALPSAGAPRITPGNVQYPLDPVQFGKYMRELLRTVPLFAVGGCCGTTPEHIRVLKEVLGCRDDDSRGC